MMSWTANCCLCFVISHTYKYDTLVYTPALLCYSKYIRRKRFYCAAALMLRFRSGVYKCLLRFRSGACKCLLLFRSGVCKCLFRVRSGVYKCLLPFRSGCTNACLRNWSEYRRLLFMHPATFSNIRLSFRRGFEYFVNFKLRNWFV
jgi:hypothetical protein